VVDDSGAFLGIVPARRLLEVLLQAHDDDFARLGGYLASTQAARLAAEERVGRRLWHRLPWLALGLAGAAVSAWLVGLFDARIESDVRLAFFIPGVVYLADAVGTQTEALVVRGLSVGAPVRRSLRLEAITAPALGLLLAGLTLPAVWLALGDPAIATTVAVALFAACSVATVVAAGLPVAMARRGADPAFGSGPLATVVQDLLSLVIYFAVAVAVLG
jgi:magnesium transporter